MCSETEVELYGPGAVNALWKEDTMSRHNVNKTNMKRIPYNRRGESERERFLRELGTDRLWGQAEIGDYKANLEGRVLAGLAALRGGSRKPRGYAALPEESDTGG